MKHLLIFSLIVFFSCSPNAEPPPVSYAIFTDKNNINDSLTIQYSINDSKDLQTLQIRESDGYWNLKTLGYGEIYFLNYNNLCNKKITYYISFAKTKLYSNLVDTFVVNTTNFYANRCGIKQPFTLNNIIANNYAVLDKSTDSLNKYHLLGRYKNGKLLYFITPKEFYWYWSGDSAKYAPVIPFVKN